MFGEITMSQAEKERAVNIMLHNLVTSGDWRVINLTLESLAKFARENVLNHDEFVSLLKKHQHSPYKSVASRANKLLRKFEHD